MGRLYEAYQSGEFDPVVGYRGSFLRMMAELEGKANGLQSPPLLIHMPGFNSDDIRSTPILGYYHAGKRYEKRLETLIQDAAAGRIDPDDIEEYLAGGVTTLEAADRWLAGKLGAQGDVLTQYSLFELWERLVASEGKGEKGNGEKGKEESEIGNRKSPEVRAHLRVRVSMPSGWTADGAEPPQDESARAVGDALLSWAMAVEYVDDLKREPKQPILGAATGLNAAYVGECRALCERVRESQRHRTTYVRLATELEARLAAEVEAATAEDLGEVDTFLFEDDCMMRESLAALIDGSDATVLEWAEKRRPTRSVWLARDQSRAGVWTLIRAGARLDAALKEHSEPLKGVHSVDDALVRYRDQAWEVDRAHRVLEQKRRALLRSQMPRFTEVRQMLDIVRARYHAWSDAMAEAFAKVCERDGYLPTRDRQQRELFEQVVRGKVRDRDRLAYVLLDGFRFEMVHDLLDRLETSSVRTKLDARLAELPSITAIGMNVLAPVSDGGRLTPVIKPGNAPKFDGFRTGNFRVYHPDSRQSAMSKRVDGQKCPVLSLDDVLTRQNLKDALKGSGLAIIHSLDLDHAGEVGQGTVAFDNILMRVASAIDELRSAGINRFVITADHGFLLEPPAETLDANGAYSARYRLDAVGQHGADVTSVAAADLRYEGTNLHVVFPRTTKSFAVAGGARNYVHGGNTLQERVIPVLELDYKAPRGGSKEKLEVVASRNVRPDPAQNSITLQLRRSQGALDFAATEPVELELEPLIEGAEVEVTHVRPSGDTPAPATVLIEPGGVYEIDFDVSGLSDGRTSIRIRTPNSAKEIEPVVVDALFTVAGRQAVPNEVAGEERLTTPPVAAPLGSGSNWASIDDPAAREVLQHIDRHGSITEEEATRKLGGPRQFRRFSREAETWQRFLGFELRVESGPLGKRYVKA